jgi:hypothetical protein
MSYTYPAQGTTSDTRELLTKVWSGEYAMAPVAPTFFYNQGFRGVKRVPNIQGTSRQMQFIAEGSAVTLQSPGDIPQGNIAARSERLITRQDSWVTKTHKLTYNEMLVVPDAILRVQDYARIEREHVEGFMDLSIAQGIALAARQTSLTSQGQFIHAGGTRQTRNGGSSNSLTAIATAYPRNSTGGTNAYNDLGSLADSLDKKNLGRGVGDRPCIMHTQLYNALLEYNDARLFSTDYLPSVDNNVQRRQVAMVLGFTVVGVTQFANANGAGNSILGGRLPGQNLTSYGLSNVRGNFTPGASDGCPVLVGAADIPGATAAAVEYWEDSPLQRYVEDEPLLKHMTFHTHLLPQIGIGFPAGAFSIEVLSN